MNLSPQNTQKLYDALAVIVLSDASREWLEQYDPKAFEQAVAALRSVEPMFKGSLDLARELLVNRREEARLRMGGFFVEVDGKPWCEAPSKLFSDVCKAGGRPTCTYNDRAEGEAHVAIVQLVAPNAKVRLRPGGCTRRED